MTAPLDDPGEWLDAELGASVLVVAAHLGEPWHAGDAGLSGPELAARHLRELGSIAGVSTHPSQGVHDD
jgi:hypothetical protein